MKNQHVGKSDRFDKKVNVLLTVKLLCLISLLRAHPEYSAKKLSQEIGVTLKAIEQQLAKLKAEGRIKRNSPDKGGSWEVI